MLQQYSVYLEAVDQLTLMHGGNSKWETNSAEGIRRVSVMLV